LTNALADPAKSPRAGVSAAFLLAAAGSFGLLFAAYANFFGNAFHFDDSHVLVDNLYIRSLTNAGSFFTDARTFSALPPNQTYRPLVSLSLAVDYALGHGLSARAFHADQLILLALLGIAVFFFHHRVMERAAPAPANRYLALFSATLFCVHTMNTETMNLMHARSEILSALGIVVGFLVYLGAPRLRRMQVHLVPMVAGALAKTPAVLLAPLLFAWELLVPGEEAKEPPRRFSARLKSALRATLPAFLAGAAVFWFVEKAMAPPSLNYGGGNRIAYAQTQLWVWLHYLRLFALPVGLSADTDLTLIPAWYDTRVIAGACALTALAWIGVRCARAPRAWPVTFGLAWFAIGLLPASSVIPLAEPLNEHRVFLPYIGLILSAVWGARLLVEAQAGRAKAIAALGVAALLALAWGTHVRNRAWKTNEGLWADVTAKSPGNGRGWMNYGTALMARGEYSRARECYARAALLTPNYWTLETNRGIVEDALGNPAIAERHFTRAIELGPQQPDTHLFFAGWLARVGRGPEAVEHLDTALRLSPGSVPARSLLMDLRAAVGDVSSNAGLAREALQADPSNARARAYVEGGFPPEFGADAAARRRTGIALGQKGDYVASALAYRAALLLEPADADALNNLGWTIGKLGYFSKAVPPLEKAIAIRPDFTLARNNLAWVRSQVK
jgi:tetratricopeptide (TPR) repeat protein